MKKKKNENFTKLTQKGISLIVLVITIIVIIILASAVILTISNNNPIAEANEARYESDRANMQAVFTTAIAKVMTQNRATVNVTAGAINTVTSGVKQTTGEVSYTVVNAQNSNNANGKIIFDKGTNTETVVYTGKQLPIYAAGETKWYVDEEGIISLEVSGVKYGEGEISFAIKVSEKPSTYYGKTVDYTTDNDTIDGLVDWQIFYSDKTNIYLIATDFIPFSICPKTIKGNSLTNNGDYKIYFNDTMINDYNGSSDITDEKLQALNSDYFSKYTSSAINMKAVAYMMDTSDTVWGTFAGKKADYAIGGPTVEMFVESYNQKYEADNVDYKAQATSEVGYQISKDGGTNWEYFCKGILNTEDTQYVISGTSRKADGMWMASPSASTSYRR